ncbi:hypothetical protein Pr1d_07710 [Bythopirellula goksoeyrii]|uniref:Uncharacterized protein n=1 Tax=Bythopirellula goksoeyrii TaxID=1400387 RepID=A0A5B9Q3G1_9BACT|nr:hypothetical protein Pr1d_07710 [Bythopirellula goksoeyrii]
MLEKFLALFAVLVNIGAYLISPHAMQAGALLHGPFAALLFVLCTYSGHEFAGIEVRRESNLVGTGE